MSQIFPVKAGEIPAGSETPLRIGIFTRMGFWFSFGGRKLQFTEEEKLRAEAVAEAINAAHHLGREEVQREFRELMGIPHPRGVYD